MCFLPDAHVFREILSSLHSTIAILQPHRNERRDATTDVFVDPLMITLQYECGIAATPKNLIDRCLDCILIIEEIVNGQHYGEINEDLISNFGDVIPFAFFERNEASWRGRVKSCAAEEVYKDVESAALHLTQAVAIDFWGVDDLLNVSESSLSSSPIVQDIFNNLFAIKVR